MWNRLFETVWIIHASFEEKMFHFVAVAHVFRLLCDDNVKRGFSYKKLLTSVGFKTKINTKVLFFSNRDENMKILKFHVIN